MGSSERTSRSIVGIAAMALFIVFIVFNTLILLKGLIDPWSSVQSDSMSPEIMMNDGVVKRPLDPGELQVGEVIVFSDPQNSSIYVVHRIVEIKHTGGQALLVTRGDNNPAVDPYLVPAGNVKGVVTRRIPWMGPVIDFADSTYGFVVTVLLPLIIIVLYLVVRYRNRRRRPTLGGKSGSQVSEHSCSCPKLAQTH